MTDTTPGTAPPGNPPMGRSHRPLKRLSFSGDGASYFGIWIVNILLSIVTIGIYSAWAKVRTRRYFYGNTFLDNDALDYHASPIAILKGRIIAVVVIIALAVLSELLPIAYLIAVLVLVVALPWIYNRSLRFNARMTSWRNVRFDFEGSYWPAFLAIIVMPVLAVFSLGLLLPVATRVRQNYMLNRLRYGTAPFEAEVPLGGLYGGLAIATLIFVAALAVLAGIGYGIFISQQHVILPLISELAGKMAGEMPELPGQVEGLDPTMIIVLMMGFYAFAILAAVAGFFAAIIYRTIARNVALNATILQGAGRLWSAISPGRMIWITLSNTIAMIFTVGLFYPWAKTRVWRYRAGQTGLLVSGDLNAFVDSNARAGDAFGSEYSDLADIDVGL